MDSDFDFKKVNLYELLEISQSASEADIRRAYRKKALQYHPDKNRDNPQAKEFFQKLSKVLEILTDSEARTSYDKILNAKKERESRNRHLDAKRKKFRDELEKREKNAGEDIDTGAEEERLKREIERIRRQGSTQLEEENQILKQKLAEEKALREAKLAEDNHNRIKIKPLSNKAPFTEESLIEHFRFFGVINFIFVSAQSAIIEYEHSHSLELAKEQSLPFWEVKILSMKEDAQSFNEKYHKKIADDYRFDGKKLEEYEEFVFGLMRSKV